MSRTLPPRPNLEHLKHQARKAYPDVQLSDALHAIAKEYGFATWPKLKEHVESLGGGPEAFGGRWVADRHTLTFTFEGDEVMIEVRSLDEKNFETRGRQRLVANGEPHFPEHGLGFSTTTSWRDARTLEVIARSPEQEVGRVVYEVSADGSTLTIRPAGVPHDGYEPTNKTVVFRRVRNQATV